VLSGRKGGREKKGGSHLAASTRGRGRERKDECGGFKGTVSIPLALAPTPKEERKRGDWNLNSILLHNGGGKEEKKERGRTVVEGERGFLRLFFEEKRKGKEGGVIWSNSLKEGRKGSASVEAFAHGIGCLVGKKKKGEEREQTGRVTVLERGKEDPGAEIVESPTRHCSPARKGGEKEGGKQSPAYLPKEKRNIMHSIPSKKREEGTLTNGRRGKGKWSATGISARHRFTLIEKKEKEKEKSTYSSLWWREKEKKRRTPSNSTGPHISNLRERGREKGDHISRLEKETRPLIGKLRLWASGGRWRNYEEKKKKKGRKRRTWDLKKKGKRRCRMAYSLFFLTREEKSPA